jgi:hypothetical protein
MVETSLKKAVACQHLATDHYVVCRCPLGACHTAPILKSQSTAGKRRLLVIVHTDQTSSGQHKRHVQQQGECLQFEADKAVSEDKREWLRCDISNNGVDVVNCLAKRDMLQTAAKRGVGEQIYMDVGAPSIAGVTSVELTSTSSASCPPDQCGVAGVTRTMQTLQQRADALGKEMHSLFQASLQLTLSPQDPAQQVLLLRKLKAGMENTLRTVQAEATKVPATVPSLVAPSRQTTKRVHDCSEANEKRKAKRHAGQRVVAALCRPDAGSQPSSAQEEPSAPMEIA